MARAELMAYQAELERVATRLGLSRVGNIESNIVEYFTKQLRGWMAVYGTPATLSELLDLVASTLKVQVVEIRDDDALKELLQRIPPSREPVMARLATEFAEDTDGITIRRNHTQPWECPFLAVINCRDRHFLRRHFSKWHEVAHLLIEGEKLTLAYRRTATVVLRREPTEILVDRVAAALAFHPDLFDPVFHDEISQAGSLTFDAIEEIRERVAPDASFQATIIACLRSSSVPICVVRAHPGYKKGEERQLERSKGSFWPEMLAPPAPKLRVAESFGSPSASPLGIRFHPRMQVPDSSIVARAFNESISVVRTGVERLEAWTTSSSGPIGWGDLHVEATKIEDDVWAILHICPDGGAHSN